MQKLIYYQHDQTHTSFTLEKQTKDEETFDRQLLSLKIIFIVEKNVQLYLRDRLDLFK